MWHSNQLRRSLPSFSRRFFAAGWNINNLWIERDRNDFLTTSCFSADLRIGQNRGIFWGIRMVDLLCFNVLARGTIWRLGIFWIISESECSLCVHRSSERVTSHSWHEAKCLWCWKMTFNMNLQFPSPHPQAVRAKWQTNPGKVNNKPRILCGRWDS